jgi:hypothetical protein
MNAQNLRTRAKAILCILALLPPLAECVPSRWTPPLTDTLANARMVDPKAVAQALTEVVRIDSTTEGGWLADLRGFDGSERRELSELLRGEGVGLADRSKLRRLANAASRGPQSWTTLQIDGFGDSDPRRAQQADGQEESTNKRQENHAGTAQSKCEQAESGSGLSGDSASSSLRCWAFRIHSISRRTWGPEYDFHLDRSTETGASTYV